jgi:hypothetical protein
MGVLARPAFVGLGGCESDVTNDPLRGFAPLANRCFVLRQEVIVKRRWIAETEFEIYPTDTGGDPSVDTFRNGGDDGENRVATLSPGTRFKIRKLIDIAGFDSHEEATATILNGPFRGRSLDVTDALHWKTVDVDGLDYFANPTIDERYLAPADTDDP